MYGYETGLFKRTKGISGSGSYPAQTSSSEFIGNGTSIFIGRELQFADIPEDFLHHYVYNVMQVNRFRHMMSELYQIGNYVVFNASVRGYCSLQEYNLVLECQRQINDCQNQISKHGVMSVIDGFSLLMDIINASNRRYVQ